jgi:hypothetical protein
MFQGFGKRRPVLFVLPGKSTGKTEGGDRRCNVWSAIVQKAESSSLFDDPASASHGGVIGFDKLSKTNGG